MYAYVVYFKESRNQYTDVRNNLRSIFVSYF